MARWLNSVHPALRYAEFSGSLQANEPPDEGDDDCPREEGEQQQDAQPGSVGGAVPTIVGTRAFHYRRLIFPTFVRLPSIFHNTDLA